MSSKIVSTVLTEEAAEYMEVVLSYVPVPFSAVGLRLVQD
jgi:hypothetical protein